jgi:hypothetical protein
VAEDRAGALTWHRHGSAIALDVARGLAYLHSCKVRSRPILAAMLASPAQVQGAKKSLQPCFGSPSHEPSKW